MSSSRRCDFYLATDGKWYVRLGNREHAWDKDDCTEYGPFNSEEKAQEYVWDNHSNPGGCNIFRDGNQPPPENPVSREKSPHQGCFFVLR